MELNSTRMYPHSSFDELYQSKGSGMFRFSERVGMGGFFYLSSTGAMAYNREVAPASTERLYDIYDVLRAVEEGRAYKLEQEEGHKIPVLWAFNLAAPPMGMLIVHNDQILEEMAEGYTSHLGFDLGARLEPKEHDPKRGYKITAFSLSTRPAVRGSAQGRPHGLHLPREGVSPNP